jgi:hypothetical protein
LLRWFNVFVLRVVRWEFCVCEQSADGVFGADGWWRAVESFKRPGDVEGGVVPEDGAFAGGVVEVGGFVEDFSGVGEDEEAVGEAFRDPKELKIVLGRVGFQMEPGPFAEVGRVGAEVDSDVPDVAREDPDELALGLAKLVVKTAKDALDGERLVVLNELGGQAG